MNKAQGVTLAMWSGPRNISTAMMRAWENRTDSRVWDEPFYANYLSQTGIDHPMANEVIATYDSDVSRLVKAASVIPDAGVFYQKHISTHMLPHIPLEWISGIEHMFLIRDPAYMVASYAVKREKLTAEDFGYAELTRVYDAVIDSGYTPLVIESSHFLDKPALYLQTMCETVGVEYQDRMLKWPAGERDSDGLWHAHWYDSVKKSTGFGPARTQSQELDAAQKKLVHECMPHYEKLRLQALVL